MLSAAHRRFHPRASGDASALPTYTPAVRALTALEGVDAYLRVRGEPRIPTEPRERADAALRSFLSGVFAERNEFGFDPARFEVAYAELERALYEGRYLSTVIAPLHGIALDRSPPRSRSATVSRWYVARRSKTRHPTPCGEMARRLTCSPS